MSDYKPPLVISIHGIRTYGGWQDQLHRILSQKDIDIPHRAHRYGRFSLKSFLLAPSRNKQIELFRDSYNAIVVEANSPINPEDFSRRPSVVAHSFGTYIVAYSLLYFEQIKLDKVILCGSILPEDFDWALIFRRDQVGHVRNEYGAKDFWAGIVKHLVRGAGDTGRRGFGLDNETFAEQKFDYFGHSAFFYELHMKDHWVKHLRKAPSSFAVIHGRDIKDAAKFHEIFEVTGNIDEKVDTSR